MLAGNYGFWIVAEQELCYFDGDEDRTAGVFLRASTSPADRNPIDFYADAGIEVVELIGSVPTTRWASPSAMRMCPKRCRRWI
jgi:porin